MMPELKNPFRSARIVGSQIPAAEYQKQSAERGHPEFVMSRGELCEFMHCPSRWLAGFQRKDSSATDFGTLMDVLVLDNHRFTSLYAVTPATYPCEPTKKDPRTEKPWRFGATYTDEWRAEQEDAGKAVIKYEELKEAEAAMNVLLEDRAIAELIKWSRKQVMVTGEYEDHDTGIIVPVKGLIDLVPDAKHPQYGKVLADFKTCASANPFAWTKAVFDHNYHMQASLYMDLYVKATGEDRSDWRHILQENYAPWQPAKRLLSVEFIELGRMKYTEALRRYCQCLKENIWPDYETGRNVIDGWTLTEAQAWMVGREAA